MRACRHRRVVIWILAVMTMGAAIGAPASASQSPGPALVIGASAHLALRTGTKLVTAIDLLNAGAVDAAAGSAIVVVGAGSPLLSGITAFPDLTMASSGMATLGNAATVNGVLTLISGTLSLAGHDLVASGIIGGSASSYVVTPDTSGCLKQSITSFGPVLFPVGNSSYNPVTIRSSIGSDAARVAVVDNPPTNGLSPTRSLTRAWLVRQFLAPGSSGDLSIAVQWNDGEAGPQFDRRLGLPTSAQACRYAAGAWTAQPGVRTGESSLAAFPAVDTLRTQLTGLWTLASPGGATAVGRPEGEGPPLFLELAQNSPNPLQQSASIAYGLPRSGPVRLEVFSLRGERVATLVDGMEEPGYHQVTFDRQRLSSGVYFYRLDAGGQTITRKLILVR